MFPGKAIEKVDEAGQRVEGSKQEDNILFFRETDL
jgi:hypothetical protein